MSESENSSGEMNRRKFLVKALLLLSALISIIIAVPVIGALLAPLFRRTQAVWRSVGNVNDFKIGETVLVNFKDASPLPWAGVTDQTASWLRRVSTDQFIAFSVNCAHLGCPVRWISDAEIFLCPCHGGVFYKDGSYASGPPPHGLDRYPVRIQKGMVEIQASPIPITTI